MKNFITLFSGMLITLLVACPLFADDTEIFVNTASNTTIRTNVLLGIDTSGSMQAHVVEQLEFDYDPSIDYVNLPGGQSLNLDVVRRGTGNGTHQNVNLNYAFDCNKDRYYATHYAIFSWVPYIQAGLPGDLDNELITRDGKTYSTCNADYENNDGYEDGVAELTAAQMTATCPAAKEALDKQGYFYDENDLCGGVNIPVNTRQQDGRNLQANFDDNLFFTGNFIAYAYRCVELKEEAACDTARFGNFVTDRITLTRNVVQDILENDEGYEINIGIARFNSQLISNGAMKPIEDYTNPAATAAALPSGGGTPLEETYYYMSNYLKNQITGSCQKSLIVYLTDGTPSGSDTGRHDEILNLANNPDPDLTDSACPNTSAGSGECLPLLSLYNNTQDLSNLRNFNNTDGSERPQTIQTHTIGFFGSDRGAFAKPSRIMRNAAKFGDGEFTLVSDTQSLREAFGSALTNVDDLTTTFTSPSVSVNNFNRLTNDDELYFTLFEPKREPVWIGNIKQYRLLDGQIVDTQDDLAVDSTTGAFRVGAQSFWTASNIDDGNDVALGGFASRLTTTRNIYSNLDASEADLSEPANVVTNSTITPALLDVASNADRDRLVNWIYGLTTDNDGNVVSTNSMGDPLHSTPIVLSYPPIVQGTGANQTREADQAIFVGTNTGFLHALDPTTSPGTNMELFSFIPKDLLPRVEEFSDNTVSSVVPKSYALDGPISSWIENDNGNGIVETTAVTGVTVNETAHIYTTMRRGGKNIYALDVTDRSNPLFEWQITGGSTGFEELGQTWSRVTQATIAYGAKVETIVDGVTVSVQPTKNVLIFAGGYDPDQDTQEDNTERTVDDQGRAIYIVDPADGSLLWRAVPENTTATNSIPQLALPQLKYSIPSDIAVIDVDSDGLAERMYVGDMGGQLWRFDILVPDTNSPTINVTGGVIADLSSNDSVANNRKFYYRPSVARVADDAFGSYLAISLGSGKRAAPLSSQIDDKFYMVKDPYIFTPKIDTTTNTPSYLYNGSQTISDAAVTDITSIANPTPGQIGNFGWSIDLSNGEKVLASAITADNNIFFTSYLPDTSNNSSSNTCDPVPRLGTGRLFGVSLFNGKATLTTGNRSIDLDAPGIAPSPQVIISEILTGGGSGGDTGDGDGDGDGDADGGGNGGTGGERPDDPPPPSCTATSADYNPVTMECGVCNPSNPDYDAATGACVPECTASDPTFNPVKNTCDAVCNPSVPGYDPATGNCDCRSISRATLLVGNQTVVPPICTEPVRTYWHRYDTDPSDL